MVYRAIKRRWRAWAFVSVYYAFITLLSQIPGSAIAPAPFENFDKLVHFSEYAVLGLFIGAAFFSRGHLSLANPKIWAAFFLVCVLAWLDEFHQRFVPGRHSDWRDWAVDVLGAMFGMACYWLIKRRLARKRSL